MFENTKTEGTTGVPIWQSKNLQVAQGGYTLDDLFVAGEVIPSGVPIGYDDTTRLAKVGKLGVAQAGATNTATQYKVLKGNLLKVGMTVKSGASAGKVITEIDKTNADYDLLTTATTLGVVIATGDAIFVDDIGYTAPKGLLYSPVIIGANGIIDVTVVLHGTVYARRIAPLTAALKAMMNLIIFSDSY